MVTKLVKSCRRVVSMNFYKVWIPEKWFGGWYCV